MPNDLVVNSVSDIGTYDPNAPEAIEQIKSLGKDEFLRMLIAQLENQDPLDPMEDKEFISQMAQFSSLEQMQNMNANLEENLNWNYLLSQTINNTMSTSLIGKDVKASGNQFYLDEGSDAALNFKLDAFAAEATISVYDGAGELVDTIKVHNLGAGDQTVRWDGLAQAGDRAPMGEYTFEVSAKTVDGKDIYATPYIFGKVDGVQYVDAQAYLVVNGAQVPLSDVIEVGQELLSDEGDG